MKQHLQSRLLATLLAILTFQWQCHESVAFVLPQTSASLSTASAFSSPSLSSSSSSLVVVAMAKKKGSNNSGGKGFGKAPPEPLSVDGKVTTTDTSTETTTQTQTPTVMEGLKSVQGGSADIPQIDQSRPVEDRTAAILREQYGLRTREEQEEAARRQEQANEQRKKLQEWKKMAEQGEDFDLMQILPAPLLIFIDRFLKAGVAICTVLFVLAGVAITVEAYSKTTGNALPEDIDNFIVQVVEPNFTPGLGILLGFSVSLGAFAAAQLSSSSSTYREDR